MKLANTDMLPPRISVVIPTYNRKDIVMRAVNSVLQQSFAPYEVIVVDDGSTDQTAQLFTTCDARIRYITKKNGGVSSARNRGIQEALGDWIAFLDSDDTWHAEKLESQINAVIDHGAGVCFTGVVTDQGGRTSAIAQLAPSLPSGQSGLFNHPIEFITRSDHHPMVQSLLIKKDLLKRVGNFDETLYVAEDTLLFYKLVASNSIVLINKPLVIITRERETPGLSDSTQLDSIARRMTCYLRVQLQAYDILIANADVMELEVFTCCIAITRKRIGHFMMRKMEICLAQGDKLKAQVFAKQCLQFTRAYKAKIKSWMTLFVPWLATRLLTD